MSCLFFSSETKYNMSYKSNHIESGRSFENFSLLVKLILKLIVIQEFVRFCTLSSCLNYVLFRYHVHDA